MAESARKIRYSSYGNVAYDPAYVDGNTVRRPKGSEVVHPHVLPQEHVNARPKVQHRAAGQISLFAAAGAVIAAVLAVAVLWQYVTLTTISNDVVALQNEYSTLKSEEARLLAQYELAYDLKSIESAVTAEGRMVKPQSSQIYYMDLSGSDSVVVFEDEASVTLKEALGALVSKVSSYFS